jgi:membrane protein insertase Oxa1/YidC/SpoIIIJ
MPIMYGIFSFFYSAAFSIYMITNTTYSLITTLIINKIMDVVFAKKEAKAELERYERKKPTDSLKKSKKK